MIVSPFESQQYHGVLCAGVDEAGRGPLAGDVVAAAVILDPLNPIDGLNDSKKLSATRREQLAEIIKAKALAYAVASASVEEIDQLNILQASLLAMSRALSQLTPSPEHALIDGNKIPKDLCCPAEAVVKGDARHAAIAAASILAKVQRDADIRAMDALYPGYGFAQHKGYPTAQHLDAVARLGVTPIHRRSFAPIKKRLQE